MHKLLILLASFTLLSSCAKKKSTTTYENDTDFTEWINQHTVKDVPNPHSGSRSSVVDSANAFSLGFSKKLEKISNTKFKEVQFSYWVLYKSNQAKASTVISIDADGKNNYWDGRLVVVKDLNRWTEVREIFKIPESIALNNQLSLYVWNNSKEEFLVDDLKVSFK